MYCIDTHTVTQNDIESQKIYEYGSLENTNAKESSNQSDMNLSVYFVK